MTVVYVMNPLRVGIITTSVEEGIVPIDFDTDLANNKCKVLEISARDMLRYQFVFG